MRHHPERQYFVCPVNDTAHGLCVEAISSKWAAIRYAEQLARCDGACAAGTLHLLVRDTDAGHTSQWRVHIETELVFSAEECEEDTSC